MNTGLIHLYCGDGKGKTTAALGLCLRALGAEMKVCLMQFLKDGSSSEMKLLRTLPDLCILETPKVCKFTFQMNEAEKADCCRRQTEAFLQALETAKTADLLILDEALGAIATGTLTESAVLDFLRNKPEGQEVVLTGRNPSESLLACADYVTEMKKCKHPYDQGISARKGIEK